MKCPNCNGTGNIGNGMWLCYVCEGTGFIEDEKPKKNPKTNFEDVTSSLERLEEFLYEVSNACFDCASRGPYKSPDCPFADAKDDPYKCNILEWLKQEAKE